MTDVRKAEARHRQTLVSLRLLTDDGPDDATLALSPSRRRRVNIFFVRHAMSCTNALHHHGKTVLARLVRLLYRDPLLTDAGVRQARKQGDNVRQQVPISFDLVASSSLMRAMETAHFMFPEASRIVPLPYVAEWHHVRENRSLPIETQREILAAVNPTILPRLDLRWAHDTGRNKAKCNEFVRWIGEHLYDLLPDESGGTLPLNIAVVSHSTYLSKCVVELGGAKPFNAQVVCAAFDHDKRTGDMTRVENGCLSDWNVPGFRSPPALLVGDVDRCRRKDLMQLGSVGNPPPV